jgi:hypothetical protein
MSVPSKAQLREQQLQAVLAAVTEHPGSTAFQAGAFMLGELARGAGLSGTAVPVTTVLSALAELEKAGRVRMEADPKGSRWYLCDPQDRQETVG